MRLHLSQLALATVCAVFCLTGCNNPADEPPTTPTVTDQTGDDHAGHDHADPATSTDSADMEAKYRIEAALAKLSPEDRESAIAQASCPVSGEALGSMGAPLKVDVDGKNVWICCDGCRDKLIADPDKYLSELAASADASDADESATATESTDAESAEPDSAE